ncbi:MAG TPA: hypothetical protein VGW38_08835 [Chloroflexota bacterium]|nr:hypothetical protein [Chloroflexota bacterium]
MTLTDNWDFDGPWARAVTPRATVDVLVGSTGERGWDSFHDVHIYTTDGRHLTGEFISVAALTRWFDERREPYWTSNLVVVHEPSLDAIRDAVEYLLESDDAGAALLLCDEDED